MTIEIYEIETFQLPDKTIMEIVPIVTDDMDLLLTFMKLAKTVDKMKLKETKARKKAGTINDKEVTESLEFTFQKLNPLADKIIDKGTRKKDEFELVPITEVVDGEVKPVTEIVSGKEVPKMIKQTIPLPYEYRNIANRIELTKKIVEISMGDVKGVVDDDPLPQKPTNK